MMDQIPRINGKGIIIKTNDKVVCPACGYEKFALSPVVQIVQGQSIEQKIPIKLQFDETSALLCLRCGAITVMQGLKVKLG